VTDEDISAIVNKLFEENKVQILEHKHSFDFNKVIYKVRDHLKWAD
jgi:hypothetical protein